MADRKGWAGGEKGVPRPGCRAQENPGDEVPDEVVRTIANERRRAGAVKKCQES